MKASIYVLLIIIYFLSIQASCNDEEPRKLIPNDSTFLSYWYFPKDSYWIYKDSASNQRDTFLVVDNFTREVNDKDANNKFQHHWYRVENRGVVRTQNGRPKRYDDNSYYYILDQSWDNVGLAIRFFYDPLNRFNNLGYTLYQQNVYDSITISGSKYYNVIHMYNKGQGLKDSIMHEYYAKDIGIIKRIYDNGVIWNLESYYISK
jgi:hypothetical protein